MVLEFYIGGGYMTLPKKTFIREMLRSGSLIKQVLNYELHQGDRKRLITVDKEAEGNTVTIRFNTETRVAVGEDYQALIKMLKKELRGDLQGQIIMVGIYYQEFTITLDLNTEDDSIVEKF